MLINKKDYANKRYGIVLLLSMSFILLFFFSYRVASDFDAELLEYLVVYFA
jgi:hypothetical protein